MTKNATRASRTTATSAARYSQSLHVLLDEPTRAAVLGLAGRAAQEIGPNVRPKEGDMVRQLLEDALERIREASPSGYRQLLREGREVLAERTRLKTQTRA